MAGKISVFLLFWVSQEQLKWTESTLAGYPVPTWVVVVAQGNEYMMDTPGHIGTSQEGLLALKEERLDLHITCGYVCA